MLLARFIVRVRRKVFLSQSCTLCLTFTVVTFGTIFFLLGYDKLKLLQLKLVNEYNKNGFFSTYQQLSLPKQSPTWTQTIYSTDYEDVSVPPARQNKPLKRPRKVSQANAANIIALIYPIVNNSNKTWLKLTTDLSICLATQTTIDRLNPIGTVAKYWRGPISIAIFLQYKYEIKVLRSFLHRMKQCNIWFNKTVLVTVVYSQKLRQELSKEASKIAKANRVDDFLDTYYNNITLTTFNFTSAAFWTKKGIIDEEEQAEIEYLETESAFSNCDLVQNSTAAFIESLVNLYKGRTRLTTKNRYAQNHLRNIARNNCKTDWIFVADVDLIPRKNSATLLQAFLKSNEAKNCEKCAFVIPTFGLNDNSVEHKIKTSVEPNNTSKEATADSHSRSCIQPNSKRDLLNMVKHKEAEPFHFASFRLAQKPTNYQKWSETFLNEEPVHISHLVNYNITSNSVFHGQYSFYEPFYISPNTIPFYDERFVGYGFTRNSQTYESIVAGWSFYVLTPIWATHCGIRSANNALRNSSQRNQQTQKNRGIYSTFMKTIWNKYRNKQARKEESKKDINKQSKLNA